MCPVCFCELPAGILVAYIFFLLYLVAYIHTVAVLPILGSSLPKCLDCLFSHLVASGVNFGVSREKEKISSSADVVRGGVNFRSDMKTLGLRLEGTNVLWDSP
jgi:hypothetical protein